MIKLDITSHSQPATTHSFECDSIIIGSLHSPSADLKLPGDLQERHLQITSQRLENRPSYFIINLAHDPFATLNGHSFGKQPLNDQDVIFVGETTFRFEAPDLDLAASIEEDNLQTEFTSQDVEALIKQVEAFSSIMPNFSKNASTLPERSTTDEKSESDNSSIPMDAIPEKEQIALTSDPDPKKTESCSAPKTPSSSEFPVTKLSLKDYYLSEYDDDKDETEQNLRQPLSQNHSNIKTKNYLYSGFKIFCSLIGIAAILLSLAYIWISDQSNEEEIRATRSVADVAMALTYAQTKNIIPQNQNWSDPEFIKNTLTAVLGPIYSSWAEFDRHGQFSTSPYMLRIFTSSNLSQFLVIAQPVPNLLHWVVPKASIVIDSHTMELRKIKELKALNRLLLAANTVEGAHSAEISALLKQGELVTLNSLTDEHDTLGFTPPKATALIHPNAENFVYNAPRYYMFGQTLVKKALDLVETSPTKYELNMFMQDLYTLATFPDLILYTTEGIQQALQSQKALTLLAPNENFLFAYLQLNSNGQIAGAHLLMDAAPSEIAIENNSQQSKENIPIQQPFENQQNNTAQKSPKAPFVQIQEQTTSKAEEYGIDQHDPLFVGLKAVINARQQALKPISDEMIALLNKQTNSSQQNFAAHFTKLQLQYLTANKEIRLESALALGVIAKDSGYLPVSRFIEYVKATELESILQDYLTTIKQRQSTTRMPEEIEMLLKQLEECSSWQELEQNTSLVTSQLNFENIPDVGKLAAYQNTARTYVIQKLNHFLVDSTGQLPPEAFMPEHRQTMITILETAWVTDPDTYNFYLAEFDNHAKHERILNLETAIENEKNILTLP